MVPECGIKVGHGLYGTGMKVVFQAPFLRQHGTATSSSVDLGDHLFPLFRLRGRLRVIEMEFCELKWGQSLDPGSEMTADREKDEFPFAFHGSQIREFGLLGMEQRRYACQEFDVVRPFDDFQHTHGLGMLDNPLR